MWNSPNNLDYFQVLQKNEISLRDDIIKNFIIPSSGVVIVFDNNDYGSYSFFPNDSIWKKNLGAHFNVQEGDGSYDSPPYTIKDIFESCCFSHLIWLSKRAWVTLGKDFVWNLSHELRHLEQDIENHWLSLCGNFLYHNIKEVLIEEEKIDVTVPTELDAELCAWRTTRKICGNSVVNQYVQNRCKDIAKGRSFQILCKYDPNSKYDVYGQTISLMRKYELPLNKINWGMHLTQVTISNIMNLRYF